MSRFYRQMLLFSALLAVTGCHDAQQAWEDTTHNMRGFRTYSEPTYIAKVDRMVTKQEPTPRYADSVFGNYRTPDTVAEGDTEVYPLRPPPKAYKVSPTAHKKIYTNRATSGAGWADDTAGSATGRAVVESVQITPLEGPTQLTPNQ